MSTTEHLNGGGGCVVETPPRKLRVVRIGEPMQSHKGAYKYLSLGRTGWNSRQCSSESALMQKCFRLALAFAGLTLISASPAVAAVDPATGCVNDIEASAALIERVYPGYESKIRMHGPEIHKEKASALSSAAKVRAVHGCDPILFGYLQSFHEGHIFFLPADHGTSAGGIQLLAGDAPSARALSKDTFYIKVPSFFPQYRGKLEALLRQYANEINDHPFLVIDIRGNHGGADDTYEPLLPLIATGPIRRLGVQALATPEIIAAWSRALTEIPPAQKLARDEVTRGRDALKAAPAGQLVTLRQDVTIVPVMHPSIRRVAILIDKGVASSGEQFLLDAKQSSKVLLIGSGTSGTLDHGDVRPFPLPSGERELWLPTTSSRRLPVSPIDEIGIAPDVASALTGDDLVSFALRALH